MKALNWINRHLILSIIMGLAVFYGIAWAADYAADQKSDGIVAHGGSVASTTRVLIQDPVDTDIVTYQTNQEIITSVLSSVYDTSAELDSLFGAKLNLAGGTLTGEVTVDNLGLEFTPGDDHTDCTAFSATGGGIWYDDSEGKFKKCQDNVISDLDTDSGGSTNYNDIGNPTGAGSIAMGANTGTYTSGTEAWGGMIIESSDVDNAGDTTLLSLKHYDDFDTNSVFLHAINDSDAGADTILKVTGLGIYIGAGTPTQTMTGDDLFVSGFLEVDGPIFADGGFTSDSATPKLTLDDSDGADAYIDNNAADADDGVSTWGVDDSVGDDQPYIELDGVNERVEFKKPVQFDADVSFPANTVDAGDIATIVESIAWNAGGITADGTQCADAAKATVNGTPSYTIICTDNDAATMYGRTVMPDSWDAGTVTFEVHYLQTAADTSALNMDIAAMCNGAGESANTWGSEIAIDDAAVTGSNGDDLTTSAAVTAAGTCAAGDVLRWRLQLDATGTTTAVATLHFMDVKMEYTSNVGD